jgi:tetratricopeptide (TPR) repeat protein
MFSAPQTVLCSLLLAVALQAGSAGSAAAATEGLEASAEVDGGSGVSAARQHFLRAVELYRAGAYDASLAAFTRAYELAPTYRLLYNLAQVQAQRQDYVQALELFGRYLREGSGLAGDARIPEARVAEVETEMLELRSRVAELRVETNVERAILVVNESRVAELPLRSPLWLNAGIHRMRVEKPGHLPVTKVVTVAGGDAPVVHFELARESFPIDLAALPAPEGLPPRAPRVAEQPRSSSRDVWVGMGLVTTGVLAAATATSGLLTYYQSGVLDRRLETYPDQISRIESARRRLRTLAVMTDVFGLAALGAAGLTTYLHLSAEPDVPPPSRARLGASVSAGGVQVWLQGAL